MTDSQRLKALLFGGLTIFMASVSVYAGITIGPIQALLPVPIIVFLAYLGWAQYRAASEGRRIADERTQHISEKAAANAFWVLLGVIAVQNGFHPIPERFTSGTYLLVGGGLVLGYQVYYRLKI